MIKEIVTHGSPVHLDELLARLMLRDYGEEKLPGVSTAIFRTIRPGENINELRKREECGEIVLLGLGGGQFDEHETNGDEEKAKECCATLVGKSLGLDQKYDWNRVLKYVLHTDKHPPTLVLDLATSVVRFQRQGWGLNSVLNYTETTVKAALDDFKGFSQTSLLNVKEQSIIINGQDYFIAIAKTDDPNITKYTLYFGAAVAIVKSSTNHIQVITNNEYHLDVRDVLRVLRIWEQKKNRNGKKITDWKTLETEESLPEVPEWYYHGDSNNILNGGTSRPDIPATKLSLDEVVSAVRIGLENSFYSSCRRNLCNSTPNKPCPWHELGLLRCRRIRYQTKRLN